MARRMNMGDSVPLTVIPLTMTLSISPPSTISRAMAHIPLLSPKNCVDWSALGLTTIPCMFMFLNPPFVSVPSFMALQWLLTTQSLMVTSSHFLGDVLLRVMASSSLSAKIPFMMTSWHPSMSMASLL